MNNVYLNPHNDGTYRACIAATAPSEDAVFLTVEGEYPVECGYISDTVYGRDICEVYQCANREELIDGLNWNGCSSHFIFHLWEYDADELLPPDIWAVFASVSQRKRERKYDAAAIERMEANIICRVGQPIRTPTVKELISILSKLPQEYRVTCCGNEGYLYLLGKDKCINIDHERYLG